MAVSGSWAAQNVYFSGADIWGHGVNPIHAVKDEGRGRQPGTDAGRTLDDVPDFLLEDSCDWNYDSGSIGMPEPEAGLRYVADRPGWNKQPARSAIPADYPEPGHNPREEAQEYHEIPHASREEAMHSEQRVHGPVTGNWGVMAKVTSRVNHSQPAPAQYERNTSMTQGMGVQQFENTRAVARGQEPRAPIRSRSVGMMAKQFGKSWEMGGGTATPRTSPYQQTEQKRPFYYRLAHVPPGFDDAYNTPEFRTPMSYVEPPPPDAGKPASATASDNWGYTGEDFYY